MYTEFLTYKKMFKNNIVNEDSLDDLLSNVENVDKEKTDVKESTSTDTEKQKQQNTQAKNAVPSLEKTVKSEGEAEMKFSIDLATEFSNTVNEFTTVCAKIVELRLIDKETSEKFHNLYSKIKNLADAAEKTL